MIAVWGAVAIANSIAYLSELLYPKTIVRFLIVTHVSIVSLFCAKGELLN